MRLLLAFVALLFVGIVSAQTSVSFEKKEYNFADGKVLPYRILYPENYDPAKKYPLVLFLHGAGERGNDNEKQLSTGIKLTAAALFVCLVFDFEIFSYMLHDGFNMLDFFYYTITLIALASFVFNKKMAIIILK